MAADEGSTDTLSAHQLFRGARSWTESRAGPLAEIAGAREMGRRGPPAGCPGARSTRRLLLWSPGAFPAGLGVGVSKGTPRATFHHPDQRRAHPDSNGAVHPHPDIPRRSRGRCPDRRTAARSWPARPQARGRAGRPPGGAVLVRGDGRRCRQPAAPARRWGCSRCHPRDSTRPHVRKHLKDG
jgi:hypothetical protein